MGEFGARPGEGSGKRRIVRPGRSGGLRQGSRQRTSRRSGYEWGIIMYCTKCGSANADDANYCSACSTALKTMTSGDALPGPPKPLFLHISVARLVLLSIASVGIYEAYWIYKNWRYIKEREGLRIRPVWRGIFGIFYCHSLLKRIKADKEASALIEPTYSVQLATGWVILVILAGIIGRAPGVAPSIIAALIPSYLFLVPVQNYINSVTEKRSPGSSYYGWSTGQIVILVFGLIVWALILFVPAE